MLGLATTNLERDYKKYKERYNKTLPCFQLFSHSMDKENILPDKQILQRIMKDSRGYIHSTFNTVSTKHWSIERFILQYDSAIEYGFTGIVIHAPRLEDPSFDSVMKLYMSFIEKKQYSKQRLPVIFIEHVVGRFLIDPEEFRRKIIQLNEKCKIEGLQFGMCIDTCHVYSSGIHLDSYGNMNEYITMATHESNFPVLIHLNDSENGFESMKDRHASIGENIWSEDKTGLEVLMDKKYDCIIELKDPDPSLDYLIRSRVDSK